MNSGWTQVPNAIIAAAGLTPTEKLVLAALLMHAMGEGTCHPSEDTLAAYVGCSPRTVRRSLTVLAAKGIIRIARADRRMTNTYTIVNGYDRTLVSAQVPDDRTCVSGQDTDDRTETTPLTGQMRHENGVMPGHQCPTNKNRSNKTTTLSADQQELLALLTAEGLTRRQALGHVRKFAERIRPAIELCNRQRKPVENRPAWIYRAFTDGFNSATRERRVPVNLGPDLMSRREYWSPEEWAAMHPETPVDGNEFGT
jgi:hypothetical protein